MSSAQHKSKYSTAGEFFQDYDSSVLDPTEVLRGALANSDVEARLLIARRALEDGADVTSVAGSERVSVVHVLLGQPTHDFEREPELLREIFDAGADVNWVSPRSGTPLQTLAGTAKFTDEELAPFYDVFFARPDLDLLKRGYRGWSTLEMVRRNGPRRAGLLARVEQYLTERGIVLPERDV